MSQYEVSAANLIKIAQLKNGMLGKVDFQKSVYLVKQLGVYLPFEFRWDKLGPYSYELAHFVNQLVARNTFSIDSGTYKANLKDILTKQSASLTTIDYETEKRISRLFSSIRQTVHRRGFYIPTFMECLGSIHFIKTSLEKSNKEDVFSILKTLKPNRFDEFTPMMEEAWILLKRNNL
jgi:uncharacterized protein YwgA